MAEAQMETYGRMKCAVGRPAHNMGTRGSRGRNSLEVTEGSAYAPGSSLRRFCLNHVGAGNAVRFGDSGAAVTGYESPTPRIFGVKSHPYGEGGRVGLKPEVRITTDVSSNSPSNQRRMVMYHHRTSFVVTAVVALTTAVTTNDVR